MLIKTIIVDDEAPALDLLERLLTNTGHIDVIGRYQNPVEALAHIWELQPDAVFLDVEMPEMNGLELANRLVEGNSTAEVVFITAYNQYAVQAFRVNALDYLLKPTTLLDVEEAVSRLLAAKGISRGQPAKTIAGHISCFGGFEVHAQGNAKRGIKWRTAKAEELFAYLFGQRANSVPKWELCEAIWPELDEDKVNTHLHTTLYCVRKALQDAHLPVQIVFANNSYTLVLPSSTTSDVAEFEDIVAKYKDVTPATQGQYERLLDLYQHDYLHGKDYPWAIPLQTIYREQLIAYAKHLAEFYLHMDQRDRAVIVLNKILQISPLEEGAHALLLRNYYETRNRVAYIRHYEAMAALLQTELGIQPQVELREWYETIART